LEYWSIGVLEGVLELAAWVPSLSHYSSTPLLHYFNPNMLQYSTTPSLQYSNLNLLQHSITPE
jgi:hypothetical protein